MHKFWEVLLDTNFLHVYKHGIVIECPDGILQQFYPHIFTYSTDYPREVFQPILCTKVHITDKDCRVLLATIHNLGACPCPHCLVPKMCIPELGMKRDNKQCTDTEQVDTPDCQSKIALVRKWIYEEGLGVKAAAVERVLATQSPVPTFVCHCTHRAWLKELMSV
jgi:hypothetical protein